MTTVEKLQNKATSFSKGVRMPSISEIEKMLLEMDIKFYSETSTNTVEHKSKGNRYVNSRHQGKTGKMLTIPLSEEESKQISWQRIELNTSDSYYSANSWLYAGQIIKLLKLRGKI